MMQGGEVHNLGCATPHYFGGNFTRSISKLLMSCQVQNKTESLKILDRLLEVILERISLRFFTAVHQSSERKLVVKNGQHLNLKSCEILIHCNTMLSSHLSSYDRDISGYLIKP
jgi:hypothetical protein